MAYHLSTSLHPWVKLNAKMGSMSSYSRSLEVADKTIVNPYGHRSLLFVEARSKGYRSLVLSCFVCRRLHSLCGASPSTVTSSFSGYSRAALFFLSRFGSRVEV
eukprot:6172365-Pleurochrysis_carterae.AAC.2